MTQEKYNGWTNRETWLVNLHFDNFIETHIQEYLYHEETEEHRQATRQEVADQIKLVVEAYLEQELNNLSTFLSDILDLSLIDWYDLAENYVDEVTE